MKLSEVYLSIIPFFKINVGRRRCCEDKCYNGHMFVAAVVGIPSAAQFEKIDKISDKIVASTII